MPQQWSALHRIQLIVNGVYQLRPAVIFQEKILYQLRRWMFRVRVLIAWETTRSLRVHVYTKDTSDYTSNERNVLNLHGNTLLNTKVLLIDLLHTSYDMISQPSSVPVLRSFYLIAQYIRHPRQ